MSSDWLTVNEIFYSIQGESSHAGRPCVFVRLTGCHLRCEWCDTAYAFYEGEKMRVEEVVARVRSYPARLVEVTGGEPLLQPGVHALMKRLCDLGYEVLLETSGSRDISGVDPRVRRIVDFKCPGSGECEANLWSNVEALRPGDEVKFVIADRADYEWARQRIAEHRLTERCEVLVSPVWERLSVADLAEWVLEDGLAVRVQTQLHKMIWPGVERGV